MEGGHVSGWWWWWGGGHGGGVAGVLLSAVTHVLTCLLLHKLTMLNFARHREPERHAAFKHGWGSPAPSLQLQQALGLAIRL